MEKQNDDFLSVIVVSDSKDDRSQDDLFEFITLVEEAGYSTGTFFQQNVKEPNASTYIGKGFISKINACLNGLAEISGRNRSSYMIATTFDLTGTQRANLKKMLNVEVVDRTFIIFN